jgi:proteasome lid subunit RPN8/RPN11
MVAQALAELPNECCGLLGGQLIADATLPEGFLGRVLHRYPLINTAASPTEYLSEAKSLLAAHKDMRQRELEILAIYHSHPASEPIPSQKDLKRNNWPGAVHFIISLMTDEPGMRGWWLMETEFREVVWEWIEKT